MAKKRPFGLLLTTLLLPLLFAGCGSTDPDLDPPRLSAHIDPSGKSTYTTGNAAEVVVISGKVQADYQNLEFEAVSDSAVTVILNSVTGAAPLLDWNAKVSNLQEGNNFVVVSASDEIGNRTQVGLLIILDLTPPTISVHQSLSPTSLTAQTIAGIVDHDAELTVSYNAVLIPVYNTVRDGQTLWESSLTGLAAGANVITIEATDPFGNSSRYNSVITVDSASPLLTIDPPPVLDATYNSTYTLSGQRGPGVSGADIALTVVSGLPPTIDDSVAGIWQATLTDIPAGLSLATATLNNSVYNSTTVPVATVQIYNDLSGPFLSDNYPPTSSVIAAVNTAITFRFSEQIEILDTTDTLIATTTGLNDRLFRLTDSAGAPVSGTLAYDDPTRTATFTPAANLNHAATYHATLLKDDGTYRILDLAGNAIDDATVTDWTFTTAAY